MLVDGMTKEDPLKASDALHQFLKSGVLSLVDVTTELEARKTDPLFKRRSNQASRDRLLSEYRENFLQYFSPLVNVVWGNCADQPLETMYTLDQRTLQL